MADRIKVNQVVAQVETQTTAVMKTTQVVAQVETQGTPLMKVYQVIMQVEYEEGTTPVGGGLFFSHG